MSEATCRLPEAMKKLFPSEDPNSDKYPDRVFYCGRWRTPGSIEATRVRTREKNKRWRGNNPDKVAAKNAQRIVVGRLYLGICRFTDKEREEILNGKTV